MAEIERITPQEARRGVTSGAALLVCAYDDEAWCRSHLPEGALTFSEFERRLPSISKTQEIIFFCA